jgi:serine/threonine-protein kinase RsbW
MRFGFDVAVSVTAASEARARVRSLAADLRPQTHADLRIVVSELVANAVKYGPGSPIRVEIEIRAPDRIRGEILDGGDSAQVPHLVARPGPAGGYGLRLVDALTSSWGVHEGSTDVWFELGA